MRRAWPVLLVAAGLAAGVGAAAAEPRLVRAETRLVVERGGTPVDRVAPTVAALVDSQVVLANAAARLGGTTPASLRSHLHASTAGGVVRIGYDGASAADAERADQEIATQFSTILRARFPGLGAPVFDPPRSVGRVSPHRLREPLAGLLGGLVAAAVALALAARRPRRAIRVAELEAAAAAETDAARAAELRAYVAVVRSQASDGVVPPALERIVREVFGSRVTG